jgi:hypothetical protein
VTSLEYILPAATLPDDVHARLDPWIQAMRGKQPAEVKELLAQRWSNLREPALKELRNRLLEFTPKSIVIHEGRGWLRADVPSADPSIGDSWYLPSPPEDIDWEAKLREFGVEGNPLLIEFTQHFGGLREDLPDMSGSFYEVHEWERFPLPGYELDEIKGAKDWQGSLIIFHARNGNSVLLHPDGRCGWWWFAEREVVENQPDLESLIRSFTRFNREFSFPFDGYPPEDRYRR